MLETLGKCAFQAAAPHLWNELPLQRCNIQSLETFENSMKTFLLRQFFEKRILICNITLCDFKVSSRIKKSSFFEIFKFQMIK